jgi:hypothetical protein
VDVVAPSAPTVELWTPFDCKNSAKAVSRSPLVPEMEHLAKRERVRFLTMCGGRQSHVCIKQSIIEKGFAECSKVSLEDPES